MRQIHERTDMFETRLARLRELKVAFVHDWLVTLGGADRVLLALHDLFPRAPVYTTFYTPRSLPDPFRLMEVRPSWLQRIPGAAARHRWLVPMMPLAVRSFDLRGYDVVISSSHSCAKGARVGHGALHICYCYTPMRYAWDRRGEYLEALPLAARPFAGAALSLLRRWDVSASRDVHHFVAISDFVAGRIRAYYHRAAAVIHPPVDVEFFTPADGMTPPDGGPFFLLVSRLVPYKRVDLAIEAFNRLGRPLVIVGDGPERARLRSLAGPTIRFVGTVSDAALRGYYRQCRGLIFPGIEDFGLTPVEAQACGRPVIAYAEGGLLESVREGVSGLFFREPTAQALVDAVRAFDGCRFDPEAIRTHAETFSMQAFQHQMTEFVEDAWSQWANSRTT